MAFNNRWMGEKTIAERIRENRDFPDMRSTRQGGGDRPDFSQSVKTAPMSEAHLISTCRANQSWMTNTLLLIFPRGHIEPSRVWNALMRAELLDSVDSISKTHVPHIYFVTCFSESAMDKCMRTLIFSEQKPLRWYSMQEDIVTVRIMRAPGAACQEDIVEPLLKYGELQGDVTWDTMRVQRSDGSYCFKKSQSRRAIIRLHPGVKISDIQAEHVVRGFSLLYLPMGRILRCGRCGDESHSYDFCPDVYCKLCRKYGHSYLRCSRYKYVKEAISQDEDFLGTNPSEKFAVELYHELVQKDEQEERLEMWREYQKKEEEERRKKQEEEEREIKEKENQEKEKKLDSESEGEDVGSKLLDIGGEDAGSKLRDEAQEEKIAGEGREKDTQEMDIEGEEQVKVGEERKEVSDGAEGEKENDRRKDEDTDNYETGDESTMDISIPCGQEGNTVEKEDLEVDEMFPPLSTPLAAHIKEDSGDWKFPKRKREKKSEEKEALVEKDLSQPAKEKPQRSRSNSPQEKRQEKKRKGPVGKKRVQFRNASGEKFHQRDTFSD